jgi:hypothetical protein
MFPLDPSVIRISHYDLIYSIRRCVSSSSFSSSLPTCLQKTMARLSMFGVWRQKGQAFIVESDLPMGKNRDLVLASHFLLVGFFLRCSLRDLWRAPVGFCE